MKHKVASYTLVFAGAALSGALMQTNQVWTGWAIALLSGFGYATLLATQTIYDVMNCYDSHQRWLADSLKQLEEMYGNKHKGD